MDSSFTTKSSPPSTVPYSSRRPSVPLQITLRNPPIGRRLLNGSNSSNTPSPTASQSEFFATPLKSLSINDTPRTSEPPPIPPRCALINPMNKHYADQFVHSNETTSKTEYNHLRSRNLRRKDLTNFRSDSADALSVPSSRQYQRQVSNEQGANSD